MSKFGLTVIALLTCLHAKAQLDSVYYYFAQAEQAESENDVLRFNDMISKAYHLYPYHPQIVLKKAIASAQLNRKDEALKILKQLVHLNAGVNLNHSAFASFQTDSAFKKLQEIQLELLKPIIHSDTAFIIRNRTLHIEAIAKASSETFYCTSIHKRKIIKVDENGNASDFTVEGQDGLAAVFSVKIDSKRNILWATSSPIPEMNGYDSTLKSAVFKYDLKTGRFIKKFFPVNGHGNVFGDLVLSKNGEVYVSDSKNNTIFKLNQKQGILEHYFSSELFINLQGIAFDKQGQSLFIADYAKGIFKLDMASKALQLLNKEFDLSLQSIDGLTYYNGSLIAIQNAITPMRVTRFYLNKSENTLVKYDFIDKAHPAFNEPTNGCIYGNEFYYIANSLWSGYDDSKKLKPLEQLQDVVVLKSKLD
jgi:sugar lactone lactonase YvrE